NVTGVQTCALPIYALRLPRSGTGGGVAPPAGGDRLLRTATGRVGTGPATRRRPHRGTDPVRPGPGQLPSGTSTPRRCLRGRRGGPTQPVAGRGESGGR